METQKKLTIEECRKYLPAGIQITDIELTQIRDYFYEFSEIVMRLDKKDVA